MDLAIENVTNAVEKNYTPNSAESNQELKRALADFVRAFGDCRKCYGKGYSTNFYGTTASPDFEGDIEYKEPMKLHVTFCDCSRGKQAQELLVPKDEQLNPHP